MHIKEHVSFLVNPDLVLCSAVLSTREEFLKILNLGSIDVLTVKLWLDKQVMIESVPLKSCFIYLSMFLVVQMEIFQNFMSFLLSFFVNKCMLAYK